MSAYYPIVLELSGRKIVIAGGGKVAERKVAGLLGTGADITVVSPVVTGKIRELAGAGKLRWLEKTLDSEDLRGAFMIFAATDDRELNQSIKKAAGFGQLVTIASNPENSDFHVPAQVKRGRLNIAVSTGGASPALARKIRLQLEEEFGKDYEDYLEFLFQARQKILSEVKDIAVKRKLLTAITSSEFLNSNHRMADFWELMSKIGS